MDLKIETNPDPDNGAYMWHRNGSCPISAVHVHPVGDHIWVEGVTRRGQDLSKSGFRLLPEEMDRLATKWLESRGLKVVTPDVVERSNLYRLM